MNHPIDAPRNGDRRWSSSDAGPGARRQQINLPPGRSWGLPTTVSRNDAAERIAEDPGKLRLAGRLISWATAGNHVRFEKVAALQQAIEAGTYNVSSSDLADKLMADMRARQK